MNINIYNEDCLPAMRLMSDNQFDLAIVDPPYGIDATNMVMGTSKNKSGKINLSTAQKAKFSTGSGKLKNRSLNSMSLRWDVKPNMEYFNELLRVSKNRIIWGGNYFHLKPTRCIICWDKVQPWENFSQWEMAWTSFNKPAAMIRISTTGGNNLESKIHPTQKPVKLYKWLLTKYAKEGDKILDTHLGSGSIAIACHDLGFDLTGYEIDKDYFDAGMKRLKLHQTILQIDYGNNK